MFLLCSHCPLFVKACCGETVSSLWMNGRKAADWGCRLLSIKAGGEVVHIICDRGVDHDALLRSIGRSDLSIVPGRGDGARSGGGPDSREPGLRIRSHDFH